MTATSSESPARADRTPAVRRTGLYGRVFAVNAAVLVLAFLLLAFTPVTVSTPILPSQAAVLAGGLVVMLVANAILLRLSLQPLARLGRMMQTVDLLEPGRRLEPGGPPEVAAVIDAFNAALVRLEEERRSSTVRVLSAQEAERHRIAQELHDQIGQNLTAVVLELKRVIDGASSDPDAIGDAQELARESLEDLRRISHDLRPAVLDDLGLVSALEALGSGFARRTGLAVDIRLCPDLQELGGQADLALYRIAQEALTNAARHGAATAVEVRLEQVGADVVLRVTDDGIGINGAAPGGGVRGMRERALMMGASLSLGTARSGRGTVVELRVPPEPVR